MRILALYDGKAGHLSQVMGAANLIQSRSPYPVSIEQCAVKPFSKIINRPLRKIAAYSDPWLNNLVPLSYQWQVPDKKPDLIISFGGNAVALNVAMAKIWKVSNIAIGNCYSLPPSCFSAHITMAGNEAEPRAIASKVALCKIDPEQSRRLGESYLSEAGHSKYWAMLIGGDGSGYRYDESDWHDLGKSMVSLSTRYGIKWLLTTSRRSSPEAEVILKRYLDQNECASASYYHSGSQRACIETLMGASERIFATEDSLSMVTEAVALQKPVMTLKPKNTIPKRVHGSTMDHMEAMGLIVRCDVSGLNQFKPEPLRITRSYQSHLDSIYDQLQVLIQCIGERRGEDDWQYRTLDELKRRAPLIPSPQIS